MMPTPKKKKGDDDDDAYDIIVEDVLKDGEEFMRSWRMIHHPLKYEEDID